MIITIDLYSGMPAYQQIVQRVREAIALGALQPGDKLPPIRHTAINAKVNRNTVGRAYLELEHQGLVQARQGSGFFVTEDGLRQERAARRQELDRLVVDLVSEAGLAGLGTDELLESVKRQAERLARAGEPQAAEED